MSNKITVIKNTVYMFLRMFFVMFLTLFSTRLLLKELGFEGYGIYDLIFGVVVLFNILSGSMATTLQRFYNVSKNDHDKQSNIYSVSLQIFSLISLFILFAGFSLADIVVGYLNIPIYHINEAVIFFQLCIMNLVFMVVRLPFVALLISNEKMGVYASLSIFDAVLKFLGVLLLSFMSLKASSLVVYGFILSLITFIVTLGYVIICYLQLNMPRIQRKINKNNYKEILSFSGWTLFGSGAVIFSQQGLSIILNKFFGVLINSANAVAQQVYNAVYQFVNSFQTAYSPYLMKVYAEGDFEKLKKLIIFFTKFSVFLYLILALPLFTFAGFILEFWLGGVPEYAVWFTRLTLLVVLFEVLSAPLWLTIQASGNIQNYQIIISLILILNLPITYLCFYVWQQPIFAFIAKILTGILAYLFRVYNVRCLSCLDFNDYIAGLLFKLVLLMIILSPIICFNMYQDNLDIYMVLLNTMYIELALIVGSLLLLINHNERKVIFNFMSKFLKRFK